MAAWGLKPEDVGFEDVFEVFPDNWEAFNLFYNMNTQWRCGPSGYTGLDYNVVPLMMKTLSIDESSLPEIMSGVMVLESEALVVMSEEREKLKKK